MIKKRIIKYILIVLLFSLPYFSYSQYWKKTSFEGIYGIGATNFMGDIGGPSTLTAGIIKQNFWLTPQSFRPVFYAGLRYINKKSAIKGSISLGSFSAADIYSDYYLRNLISNTYFIELSGQYEYFFIQEKGKRNVYRTRTFKWYKNLNIPTYVFIGLGGNFFIANIERNKRYLYEPFDKTPFAYATTDPKHITFVIPFGIGIKYRLNKVVRFGVEAGYHFAFSDYLDNYSPTSSNWPDSYQFLLFTLNYKLKTGRSGLPRISFR